MSPVSIAHHKCSLNLMLIYKPRLKSVVDWWPALVTSNRTAINTSVKLSLSPHTNCICNDVDALDRLEML